VDAVPAVGSRIDDGGTVATLAQGKLVARVSLDAGAFSRVDKGQQVEVTGDGVDSPLPGRVATLVPDVSHGDPQITVAFDTPPGENLADRSVVATITIQAVPERGLIVPTRAVADDPDGTSHVIVKRGAGRLSVAVRVVGSLNGRSVIDPVDTSVGATLKAGDLVQVG
jgi:hypothetical protein